MIRIVAVGKIKESGLKALIADYVQRIRRFLKLQVIEVADIPDNRPLVKVLNEEAKAILKELKPKDFVILLAIDGIVLDSERFAVLLNDWRNKPTDVVFVIGGSNGVSREVKGRADYCWSLSALTFPHQLSRLILVEQLYRGLMIADNRCYHK